MKPFPDFRHESPYWEQNTYVIGLDEVGRGCLAGPVYVGGVCFPFLSLKEQKSIKKHKIHDSKLCTIKKRQKLAPVVKDIALFAYTASSTVDEINTFGIVPAIEKAEVQIIRQITSQLPDDAIWIVFTDTLPLKALRGKKTRSGGYVQQVAIPQGDANTITIAAASIIAKVERDAHMDELHKEYPHYEWCTNKGYATKSHRAAIQNNGICPLHRTLYVRKLLGMMP